MTEENKQYYLDQIPFQFDCHCIRERGGAGMPIEEQDRQWGWHNFWGNLSGPAVMKIHSRDLTREEFGEIQVAAQEYFEANWVD